MIEGIEPYPSYAPARVPWAPELPIHWRVERGKALFRKVVRPVRPDDEVVTCFRDGTVTLRRNRRTSGFTEAIKELGYQGIRRGDLVIHAMDAFAGAVGVADSDGKGTPVYGVCVPRHAANTRYYAHIVREMARQQWVLALARGIRERSTDFRFDAFAVQDLPVPPPEEQAAIVRFLDHADRRIRRYIRAKQKLIKLLEEQKQAIIHQAVTRGLDPGVPMKDSGVEWLGTIPKHWSISRVKAEFESLNSHRVPLSGTERGKMTSRSYDYYGASGVIDKVDDFLFDDELLLIAEDGANLVLRNLPLAIIARGQFWVNNHAHILKPRTGNMEYLAGMMETIDYSPWITGAAQPKLTKDRLMSIQIAVPPGTEQHAIVDAIRGETSLLRASIEAARREVTLLQELRTRLISDVVTGQLDVRSAAAALPDDPLPDEPLDEPDDADLGADADTAPEDPET